MPRPDLLTTRQAADLAGVSTQTIINWIEIKKRFPCQRIETGPRMIPVAPFRDYLISINYPIPEEIAA